MEFSSRRRICDEAVKGRDELCINLFFFLMSSPARFGQRAVFIFIFLVERIHSKKEYEKKKKRVEGRLGPKRARKGERRWGI